MKSKENKETNYTKENAFKCVFGDYITDTTKDDDEPVTWSVAKDILLNDSSKDMYKLWEESGCFDVSVFNPAMTLRRHGIPAQEEENNYLASLKDYKESLLSDVILELADVWNSQALRYDELLEEETKKEMKEKETQFCDKIKEECNRFITKQEHDKSRKDYLQMYIDALIDSEKDIPSAIIVEYRELIK